jgi:transcriptional regulator NrdR family protein
MSAMECPHCGNYDNKIIKSILRINTNTRIRIGLCLHCGARVPTNERIDLSLFRKLNPTRKVQEEA